MDWHRPVAIFALVLLTIFFSWNDKDLGLYIVLLFACVIAIYLIFKERSRVTARRTKAARWQDYVNSSVNISFSEVGKRAQKDALFGVGILDGCPCVVRLSPLAKQGELLVEVASVLPDIQPNEIFQVSAKSVRDLGSELDLQIIESSKLSAKIKSEFFTPFALPPIEQNKADFEAALALARNKAPLRKPVFNSWRIRFSPAVIGTFLTLLTTRDALSGQSDLWVYPFWIIGVALLIFAFRFGVSFDGTSIRYCDGLRIHRWSIQEISSVTPEFRETSGIYGKTGGMYPLVKLSNGITADLTMFAYSRKDAIQAYLLIESLCGTEAAVAPQ